MPTLTVQDQDNLIRALIEHPDNFDRSPQFALGYIVSMMTRMMRHMPKEQQDLFVADVEFIIERHKRKQ
jgi:hypothetical protein